MPGPKRVSIIVPVLNEEARINPLITHLRTLDYSSHAEIIVVDGSRTSGTLHAISHGEITKIASPPGRAAQMNAGARSATGEILLFLHADTELPQDGLTRISRAMEDGAYGAGAFLLGIGAPGRIFRLIERISSLRSRITRVPFGDQAIFMRREYFREISGYREIPIMEDVEIMRRIRSRGDTIVFIPERVRTSPRRWEKEGIFVCTLRNWVIQALYLLRVSPEKLARFYPGD